MGYAPELYQMINISFSMIEPLRSSTIKANYDLNNDQLYQSLVYLDEKKRHELNIKLDSCSELFQSLAGPGATAITRDFELRFEGKEDPR